MGTSLQVALVTKVMQISQLAPRRALWVSDRALRTGKYSVVIG